LTRSVKFGGNKPESLSRTNGRVVSLGHGLNPLVALHLFDVVRTVKRIGKKINREAINKVINLQNRWVAWIS
jgi:hypothetical protein